MDIQAEKLNLIKWLAEINDLEVIKQFKTLQKSSLEKGAIILTDAEKSAIDQGLKSIEEDRVQSHERVVEITKSKYPTLFK
tara:strand:- start:1861 stop:2103 length:243 start_codon:yes stop_codon:yes gene_type:complete